jgi:hypothetical protein
MPPRKKAAQTPPTRPAHLSELCPECGRHEVTTHTSFTCEHGSWEIPPETESDDEFLDELGAGSGDDE